MKRLLKAAGALFCAFGSILAHAQLTPITAESISMGGVPIAAGVVTFTPVNLSGIPIAFATGGGGLNAPTAFSGVIANGAITGTFLVPDACLTTPANILYTIQITNTATQKSFTLQSVPNVCGSSWALDHYGPPAPTNNVQAMQVAYGTAAAPDPCINASFYVRDSGGGQLYTCVSSHPVLVTGAGGGSVTFGTTAGTAAEGNDSRIVGAEQTSNKGAASGYAGLDSSSHLLDANLTNANANVGSCGDATHVAQVTLDAKGRATACTGVPITGATVTAAAMKAALSSATGCTTSGFMWSPQSNTCLAASGGTTPGSTAGLYAWDGTAWVPATAAQVKAALTDPVNNSQLAFSTGSGGDATISAPTSGMDFLAMKGGQINYSHNGSAYAPLPTAPTASSINTLIQGLTGCNTATFLYNPSTGTCVAPSGGSSGPSMIVPRDINAHYEVANPSNNNFSTVGWFGGNSIGTLTPVVVPDAAGYVSNSYTTGATINTSVGQVSSKDVNGLNPSFKGIFHLQSADNVNAWIGLCAFCSTTIAGTTTGNMAFVGFRHVSSAEATNWTCYAGTSSASNTADSGVAVDVAKMQVFDVIYVSNVPQFYINGTRVCSSIITTALPSTTGAIGAAAVWQNTTTTPVLANIFKLYYGAN